MMQTACAPLLIEICGSRAGLVQVVAEVREGH